MRGCSSINCAGKVTGHWFPENANEDRQEKALLQRNSLSVDEIAN